MPAVRYVTGKDWKKQRETVRCGVRGSFSEFSDNDGHEDRERRDQARNLGGAR